MSTKHSLTLRTRAFGTGLALVALTITIASRASAEPNEDARKTARAAMAAGRQARDHGDLQTALKSFSRADEIMHVPTTALEVAKTQVSLGSLVEADATLRHIADTPAVGNEPEAYVRAREEAAAVEQDLSSRIPLLTFVVEPTQSTAPELTVDGTLLDSHAWTDGYAVNPGRHVIVASSGEVRLEKTADVPEKHVELVHFEFPALDAARTPSATSATSAPLPLDRRSSGPSATLYTAYGLSGLALASAGAGVAFGLIGNSRKHDLEQQCAPSCTPDRVDRARSMYTLANVSFAVSASSAIAAIVLYAIEPSSRSTRASVQRSPKRFAVDVNAGTRAAGVIVNGSF